MKSEKLISADALKNRLKNDLPAYSNLEIDPIIEVQDVVKIIDAMPPADIRIEEFERMIKYQSDRINELLDRLEEKEPVKPIGGHEKIGWIMDYGKVYKESYRCGYCHNFIGHGDAFCKTCGRKVKWDE